MAPDRWRQVESLCHAALARPAGERAAFLAEACSDDEPLRLEVESLLAGAESSPSFLEAPIDVASRPSLVGRQLGAYRIDAALGAGGMGEVYRAKDTRLGRDVAVKILPATFAADPQRRTRFEREARAVAALHHPNICTIHDVGHDQGIDFLVMELVEGETLAARLAKGPMPLDEALARAMEIADALNTAHGQGIIHRDLKPGNVMLAKAGSGKSPATQAKLLDFGLARIVPSGVAAAAAVRADTSPMTETGAVLGTVQYMAPEQIEGRPADARTDIFTFGVLFYEMLTGRRTFEGSSTAALMAAILREDPPPVHPREVGRIVRRCLAKDPIRRYQSTRDLLNDLEEVQQSVDAGRLETSGRKRIRSLRSATSSGNAGLVPRFRTRWLVPAVGMAAIAAAFIAGWLLRPATGVSTPAVVRFTVSADDSTPWPASIGIPSIALSPDGQTLAWAIPDGRHPLMVRRLADGESRAVEGSTGASSPFFSPDGEWIGFYLDSHLKRAPVARGEPTSICALAHSLRGAVWGEDDQIIYATRPGGLWRVRASGGEPELLLAQQSGSYFAWPALLPGGKTVIATRRSAFGLETGTLIALRLGSKATRDLISNASDGSYSQGRLFFGRAESLWTIAFDPVRQEIAANPAPAVDRVERAAGNGETQYAVSSNGALAYVPLQSNRVTALQVLDRSGNAEPVSFDLQPSRYSFLAVSPDGTRAAIREGSGTPRIVVIRLDTGTTTKIPTQSVGNGLSWAPDGQSLFYSGGAGMATVWSVSADGTTPPRRVTAEGEAAQDVMDVTFRSEVIYRTQGVPGVLSVLSPAGATRRIGVPPAFESTQLRVSPDGQWLAYSVGGDVMLQQAHEKGTHRVRIARGTWPFWAPDGAMLYFLEPGEGETVHVAGVTVSDPLKREPPKPVRLFACARCAEVQVLRNGFVVLRTVSKPRPPASINVVLNWMSELAKRPDGNGRD